MESIKCGKNEVLIENSGLTILGDGIEFRFFAPRFQSFPIDSNLDSLKEINSPYGLLGTSNEEILDKYFKEETFSSEDHGTVPWVNKFSPHKSTDMYSQHKSFNKKNISNIYNIDKKNIEISTFLKNEFPKDSLERTIENSLLILNGNEMPTIHIGCSYSPRGNTLTPINVFRPGDRSTLTNCEDFILAQEICDNAVDELDIHNAHNMLRSNNCRLTLKSILSNPVSETLKRYLEK